MLKEIMEEPVVLEKTLKPYIDNLDKLPDLTNYEEIHIVACGSAMYAGMIGKTLIEENTNLRVTVEVASEYRYKKVIYDRKTLVILISQSGETADTIAAMRKAKMGKASRPTQVSQSLPGTRVAHRWSHSIAAMAKIWRKKDVVSNLKVLFIKYPPCCFPQYTRKVPLLQFPLFISAILVYTIPIRRKLH